MGLFHSHYVLMLLVLYQCDGHSHFNTHKTLHHEHANLDWMKCVPDTNPLSSVSIPGTHHSITSTGVFWYRTQAWDLPSQMNAGVRFFDVHLTLLKEEPVVRHGLLGIFPKQKFKHVLEHMQIFLKGQKTEALMLRVSPEKDAVTKTIKLLSKPVIWNKSEIPNMGEVRGKIVLIQSSTLKLGLPVNVMELETNKEMSMKKNIKEASEHCRNEMRLSDTGAKGKFERPETVAKTLNKQIDDYLLNLYSSRNKPACIGIIAMDFPGPKLINVIINFNCYGNSFTNGADTGPDGVVALNDTTTGKPEPGPPAPEPGPTELKPGPSTPEPGPTEPKPGPSPPEPGPTELKPAPSTPEPGPTTPEPGPTEPKPGPSAPEPGPTTLEPGPTEPKPGPSAPEPGPTTLEPGPTEPKPGPSTPEPGPTTLEPGPTEPKPGPSTPEPGLTTPEPGLTTPEPGLIKPKPGPSTPEPGRPPPVKTRKRKCHKVYRGKPSPIFNSS